MIYKHIINGAPGVLPDKHANVSADASSSRVSHGDSNHRSTSELLDPNPFVPSPKKPKATPGVGDKRALPIDAVCIPSHPCHIVARPATELRPTVASRAGVPARRGRIRSGRR